MVLYLVGRGQEENTSLPGAAISILPKLEKAEGFRSGSSEATAMIVGELAGAPVGRGGTLLPAAAMIRQLLLRADLPAAV
jgi:hypothetical protein